MCRQSSKIKKIFVDLFRKMRYDIGELLWRLAKRFPAERACRIPARKYTARVPKFKKGAG
jgi:hypothetical protein